MVYSSTERKLRSKGRTGYSEQCLQGYHYLCKGPCTCPRDKYRRAEEGLKQAYGLKGEPVNAELEKGI